MLKECIEIKMKFHDKPIECIESKMKFHDKPKECIESKMKFHDKPIECVESKMKFHEIEENAPFPIAQKQWTLFCPFLIFHYS